jgi:hypothetical protein
MAFKWAAAITAILLITAIVYALVRRDWALVFLLSIVAVVVCTIIDLVCWRSQKKAH